MLLTASSIVFADRKRELMQFSPVLPRCGLRLWGLSALVAVIPFLFGGPLIVVGIDDLHAVRHLDDGEFVILRAWKDVYPNGPLYAGPFDPHYIYPKAFYNLAGFILYPYAYFRGEDFQMVLIVWRTLNALLGTAAVVMLFFLIRRVFRSNAAALVASGLFAVTPEFLAWTANVRPNPLDQMLTFATLLILALLCERFSYRLFLLATLAGALAFATKYGGVPFLILVPGLSVYLIWHRNGGEDLVAAVLRQQVRVLRAAFPFLFVAVGIGLATFGWLFDRQGWDAVSLFVSLSSSAFPSDLLLKVVEKLNHWRSFVNAVAWGTLGALLAVEVALVLLWRWSKRWILTGSIRPGVPTYTFLIGMFFFQTAAIYVAIFFITSPAYAANPAHFVSEFGFMIYYMALGGSFDDLQIPGMLESLRLTAREVHAWWLIGPPIAYAVFVQVVDRCPSVQSYHSRAVLWIYSLVSMGTFLSMPIPQVRHILPTVGLLYGFVGYAVARRVQGWRFNSLPQKAFSVLLIVLVLGYAGANVAVSVDRFLDKRERSEDVGFDVGNWIRAQYDPSTRILTDYWNFYTPPEFQNVSTTTYAEWKGRSRAEKEQHVKQLIVAFQPEVIIVTTEKSHAKAVNLEELFTIDTALRDRHFGLVKSFQSQRRGGRLNEVRIYQVGYP